MWRRRITVVGPLLLFTVTVSIVSFLAGVRLGGKSGSVLASRQLLRIKKGSAQINTFQLADQLAVVQEVWEILNHEYVGRPIEHDELIKGAIDGMIDTLNDAHTNYLTPQQKQALERRRDSFEGIGAQVELENGEVKIVTPFPDSPAEEAGLQPGDVIIAIDGDDLTGLDLTEAVSKIRGPAGSKVVLTVRRSGVFESFEVTVQRAVIPYRSVDGRILEKGIGYVQIRDFSDGTSEQLRETLDTLEDKGAAYLILDLRNNPGGLLNESVEVVSRFIDEGPVLYWEDAERRIRPISLRNRPVLRWPMVVLINGGSASASEIVAGALQDRDRATLAGERTFGKGTVQNVHDLQNGGSLRVTTAYWLTPKQRRIEGNGIVPDVVIEGDRRGHDKQLTWARRYLRARIERHRRFEPR